MRATDAVIAVTYRCNSRCAMCDIWKTSGSEELAPERYRALPSTLKNVNITGGEPFLRNDLPEIISAIRERCPGVRLVISTNGFLTERIVQAARSFPPLGIRVSIDGPGALHDQIRGVKGAYERALRTIAKLKEMGHRDLGISLTASKLNAGKLSEVKELADALDVEFTCTVVHSSSIYFGDATDLSPGEEIAAELERIRDSHLRSPRVKDWFRAYYVEGLAAHAAGKPKAILCRAARGSFFMNPSGEVYACNVLNRKLGHIRKGGPFVGDRETLSFIAKCPMRCWMICTIAPAMRRNPFPALAWIVKRKLETALPRSVAAIRRPEFEAPDGAAAEFKKEG